MALKKELNYEIHWEDKFFLVLFGTVSENLILRVNFHPDDGLCEFWVEGLVQDVKSRLDGKQTVDLKLICKRLAA